MAEAHKSARRFARGLDRRVAGVVLVIGAPGAGKTSLVEALANELERAQISFGALESEQLAWGYPLLAPTDWAATLEAVLASQRAAGRDLFLIAATPESRGDLELLADACAPDVPVVACVLAHAETVAERLAQREDDAWVGKDELVARARKLAEAVPSLTGIDVRLDSERAGPRQLARQLLMHVGDRLVTDPSRGA